MVDKSRSHVANMMRLTKLPDQVQAYIAEGKLSAGHARALIGVPGCESMALMVEQKGLSVRETEQLTRDTCS